MTRKKNLSKDDLEDVSTWQNQSESQRGNNQLSDIQIKIKCKNEKQKQLKKAIEDNVITLAIGPAGTGKTYLSLITALHLMKRDPSYRKLVLIKSLQTIKGEELGFLPGTLQEKMEPYMTSFTGNLDKIIGKGNRVSLMEDSVIHIEPIAYIRGNTLDNSIIIIDETQNIDMHTFKTIITRIGQYSKMIFLGDIEQIDRKVKKESCLENVYRAFEKSDFTGAVEFEAEECVRNPIIPKVLGVLNQIE